MRVDEVLKELVQDSGMSMYRISLNMGRSKLYISQAIYEKRIPSIKSMAEIADVTGHDLLLRNRTTGREIIIDPPKKEENDET